MTLQYHEPVMVAECLAWLLGDGRRVIVDATAGHGGHSLAIAERMPRDGLLILVDEVADRLEIARQRLAHTGVRLLTLAGNFRDLAGMLSEHGVHRVHGVLYDQGLCSADIDGDAGFSFAHDAPLDMRRGPSARAPASELLARWSQRDLARVFRELGDERWANRIAAAIVRQRQVQPLTRTTQLVALIEQTIPRAAWPPDIHVATRCFMAVRYAVNDDIGAIRESIQAIAPMLEPGGRIVCLSYNSIEDRAVRGVFRTLEHPCVCPRSLPVCGCGRTPVLRVLTRKALRPSEEERARNPRSRSALLRVAERVPSATVRRENAYGN